MNKATKILVAVVLAALAIAWIYHPAPPDNTPNTKLHSPIASVVSSLPKTHLEAHPLQEPPSQSVPSLATSAAALSSLHPPDRPAWEILRDYRNRPADRKQEDSVLSAMSYCINTQDSADTLRSLKSRGTAVPGEIDALEAHVEGHAKFCGRLLPTDFQVRTEIVRSRAESGDTKAMMAFLDIGPGGYWPSEGSPPGWTQEQKYAWQQEALVYLKKAVERNELSALNALATVYSSQPSGNSETDPFFSNLYDPVQAYAYAYAWSIKTFRVPDPYQEKARDLYLQRFQRPLTSEEIAKGQKIAGEIIR